MITKKNVFSSLRLRQIINDLKRRPEDAAIDLKISQSVFNQYLRGKKQIDEGFVKKAVNVWPVNITDFINPNFNKSSRYKIVRFKDSKKTSRVMQRGGNDYYEYRDTVMDRDAPFRPEWIRQLAYVKTNSPKEKNLKWNRGHLLHQLTYFVGEVNFYYIDKNNKKRSTIMNTGDSMYIAPYVPHTFASRNQNCEGYIVAITFSDKITQNIQNEIIKFDKKQIVKILFSKKLKTQNKVTIKKFKTRKNNTSKKPLTIYQLAKNNIIPTTNFLRIDVNKNNSLNLSNSYHQYIYILSDNSKLKIENKTMKFNRGDTIYLRPFLDYVLQSQKTKVLIAQVESLFTKDLIKQLQHVGKNNFKRLLNDNSQWFKK